MTRIAVLTSGGDAPRMNAAIRAVTRSALDRGWEVYGVRNGFAGLISDHLEPLSARSVGSIIQSGGTFLGSAHAARISKLRKGASRPYFNLGNRTIEALVVIGGDGSQAGAHALSQMGVRVLGVASTIDNDPAGCDISIGVDTALNIALESIDRLKTTASSHQRAFLVEVMGRNCGYLALMAAIAGGAEVLVIPEVEIRLNKSLRPCARFTTRVRHTRSRLSPKARAITLMRSLLISGNTRSALALICAPPLSGTFSAAAPRRLMIGCSPAGSAPVPSRLWLEARAVF